MQKGNELTKEQKKIIKGLVLTSCLYFVGVFSGIALSSKRIADAVSLVNEHNERVIGHEAFGIGYQEGKNDVVETVINGGEKGIELTASDGSTCKLFAKDVKLK